MGRNNIPKLGEWRDGKRYMFKARRAYPTSGEDDLPRPDDGKYIVYTLETRGVDGEEVLAVCWADGFQECMASMWNSGYVKGKRAGR